jgi:hypothetical protein
MGQPRFLHRGLIALSLLSLAACGVDKEDLLVPSDFVAEVYKASGGAGRYRPSSTDPSQRGTIVGRVTYEGKRRLKDYAPTDAFCKDIYPKGILTEEIRVNPEGALRDVVVYVKRGLSRMKFETPSDTVVLDQKGCEYIPHIAVLRVGQPLVIRNSDATMHNVHGGGGVNAEFNRAMSTVGQLNPLTFSRTEVAKRVWCDVHGWMESWVAILPHPCHAITGEDGRYRIEGVPPGKFQLAFWHEELGEQVQDIDLAGKATLEVDFNYPG